MSRFRRFCPRQAVASAAFASLLVVTGCAANAHSPTSASVPSSAGPSAPPATSRSVDASPGQSRVAAASATSSARSAPNRCARNQHRQLVHVDVSAQHVWMCANHRLVLDSPVTTGAVGLPYDATPTGTFRVQEKDRDQTLTLASGQTYAVRYWIPFDAPLFGFHDARWQTMPFGSQRFRTLGSHGCVHMPMRAMRFLYHWADVGAVVRVTA